MHLRPRRSIHGATRVACVAVPLPCSMRRHAHFGGLCAGSPPCSWLRPQVERQRLQWWVAHYAIARSAWRAASSWCKSASCLVRMPRGRGCGPARRSRAGGPRGAAGRLPARPAAPRGGRPPDWRGRAPSRGRASCRATRRPSPPAAGARVSRRRRGLPGVAVRPPSSQRTRSSCPPGGPPPVSGRRASRGRAAASATRYAAWAAGSAGSGAVSARRTSSSASAAR